jgi:hypothetical protein
MTSARTISPEELRLLRSITLFIPICGTAVVLLVALGGLIAG